MTKINTKYHYLLILLAISLGLLNAGCLENWKSFSFRKDVKDVKNVKNERINNLEEKVVKLTNSVERLNSSNNRLDKRLHDIKLEQNPSYSREYKQLKDKQDAIEAIQKIQGSERDRLQKELADTQNILKEIKHKLALVEVDKVEIKAELKELKSSYTKTLKALEARTETKGVAKTASVEKPKRDTKKINAKDEKKSGSDTKIPKGKYDVKTTGGEKTGIDTTKNRKSLIKEDQEKRKSSLIEELLDKAIKRYREGKYKNAIAKWEEVLALDPSKLEAKFNIEIAQDRIKEREVQEGLKSNLIQRK